jgi:hypothetical protein
MRSGRDGSDLVVDQKGARERNRLFRKAGTMCDEERLQALLEKVLNEGCTPEEACAECPELLEKVRARLAELRTLERELDQMFPRSSPEPGETEPESKRPCE